VAIINEAFARKYFPDQNPIGKRINPAISADDRPLPMREIIAVAANTRSKTLSEAPVPEVYLHLPQCPATGSFSLVFRTSLESQLLASSARTAVAAVDRNAPITQIRAFDEYFVETLRLPRFHALLIGAFAGLALLLAAIGLYGIMAFAVSQRTAEIGVRMALGARGVDVLRLILTQGMKLVLVGLAFGATGALVFTQWLKTLLFGVTATDPTIFLAAAGLLVLAGLAACWIPARRATRVDPLVALNCE
jgi:putative ABC transport system permease protein